MQIVSGYLSDDGCYFDSFEACQYHEAKNKITALHITSLYSSTISADALINILILHRKEIIHFCQSHDHYINSLPQEATAHDTDQEPVTVEI